MLNRLLAASFALAAALTSGAQQPTRSVNGVGPQIGDVAPDFELPDQHGTPRRLSSLLGAKGAMLVFYRSADW
jgi:hypothetical protein